MKLRVRLAKERRARFFSHLDVQRTLERTLRRAALPLAYSQGFSPHPRISFASALATGVSSEGEFIDVELSESVTPAEFIERSNASFPPGLAFLEAREVAPKGDSLFSLIDAAEYRLTFSGVSASALAGAVKAFLALESVEVEKEGKRGARLVNIREQVHLLEVEGGAERGVTLRAVLQSGAQGSLKAETLADGLKLISPDMVSAELAGVHRLMIYRRDARSGALELPWNL
ncbi:MAG TPA: TIGR03936 family radical SAM-associated protein [Symbiobacteriaceae bacterium]|nr:TIGR03936 family radical SAM-associated protein [Symbiobacteriaceae bacterium]